MPVKALTLDTGGTILDCTAASAVPSPPRVQDTA